MCTRPLLLLLALAACEAPRAEDALDPVGRMMLDPLRVQALDPDELVRRLALAEDATVADLGAGPGFLTLYLAGAVPRGRVIATDVNAAYLAVAERRARAAGFDQVLTRTVQAEHPGLEPSSIDAAVLCQVDHFLPDRTAYFRELTAALRPQGSIVVLNFNRYIEGARRSAEDASLQEIDHWSPSVSFTAIMLRHRPAADTRED